MINVLIYGLKSNIGGGKTILNNYVETLYSHGPTGYYIILTPNKEYYKKFNCEHIKIIDLPKPYRHNISFWMLYNVILPKVIRKYNIRSIFNLGDIPIPTQVHQVYLFDWPYAVYPESVAWERMDHKNRWIRKAKLIVFHKYIKYAKVIIAQSCTVKKRLRYIYNLDNVTVLPNSVPAEAMSSRKYKDFELPNDCYKLLYLTHYYTHKNLEILLPLAMKIKRDALPYRFIVTLDANQNRQANGLINNINRLGLRDIIINVGTVPSDCVCSLYKQSDALFMPTLLESYGLPYIEAMFNEIPVLTSNYDFAMDVCGDAAFYFDPLCPDSIINTIDISCYNKGLRKEKVLIGKHRVDKLIDNNNLFKQYQGLILKKYNIN